MHPAIQLFLLIVVVVQSIVLVCVVRMFRKVVAENYLKHSRACDNIHWKADDLNHWSDQYHVLRNEVARAIAEATPEQLSSQVARSAISIIAVLEAPIDGHGKSINVLHLENAMTLLETSLLAMYENITGKKIPAPTKAVRDDAWNWFRSL
jgi:cell division protein FtsL